MTASNYRRMGLLSDEDVIVSKKDLRNLLEIIRISRDPLGEDDRRDNKDLVLSGVRSDMANKFLNQFNAGLVLMPRELTKEMMYKVRSQVNPNPRLVYNPVTTTSYEDYLDFKNKYIALIDYVHCMNAGGGDE